MYLKALEIQGFKSFADKTRLSFEKNITAIVGPNGAGKSNISDAILWVMGEQSSKTLRGSKMEDVIFGGTQNRNPLGFAQVSLILDNSGGLFPVEGSELMLTRRYYRNGESEYLINRQPVRLKDVHALLMDTGLGRDGYSIIGQGRISEIVSSRSLDRREVFEEAAGISRFRYRKEEAERRLQKTEDNLLRVNDKIEELEMQVGPLREQAEKAKEYLLLRDELRVREVSLWITTLEKLRRQSENIRKEYDQLSDELADAKAALESLYASSEGITERMHRKDIEVEEARERLSAAEAKLAAQEAEIAVIRANMESTVENSRHMEEELAKQRERLDEIQAEISGGETRVKALDEEERSNSTEIERSENILKGFAMKLESRQNILQHDTDAVNAAEVELSTVQARVRMLSDMERSFEGYSKAVKTVMREAGRGTLRAVHGPVSGLIRTDGENALAIETALGNAGQNIVVDTQQDARLAIEMLQRQDAGRATFLPVDTLRGSRIRDIDDPGFVGIASDLVKADPRYEQIVLNLLGRTVVAERLTDAIRIAKKHENKLRIVTLDGQMIHAGGSMTGGSSSHGSGILSRASELEKLRKRQEEADRRLQEAKARLEATKRAVEKITYDHQMASEDREALRRRQASIEAERRSTMMSVEQFRALLQAITGDSESRRRTIESVKRQLESLRERETEQQKRREEIIRTVEQEKSVIRALTSEKLDLEGRRTRADREAQKQNADINDLERRCSRAEQRKVTAELEEKQIVDKLWDNYELSYSAAESVRHPVESIQKEARAIAELKRKMSELGNPNIGAIEEFDRVNGRYTFLTDQRDDVEKAKKELVNIIRDLTRDMEKIFVDRFNEINVRFGETFRELFGGGMASIVLEDEAQVLDCGIDIRVQPPGKALSTISLLSGGEMAFVAIALYFAILKVRPTPFCVMDEIDAALDEENVARFADYMRGFSDKTQFVVITHRRATMESTDMLYGVTMQERGVSQILSLDLDAARKTLEE